MAISYLYALQELFWRNLHRRPGLLCHHLPLPIFRLPPNTSLFHGSCQIAFLSINRCIGPGKYCAMSGILSSNKNAAITTNAITDDSLNFFVTANVYIKKKRAVTPVAINTSSNSQTAST